MQEYLVSGQEELLEEGLSDLPTPRIIDVYRDRLNAIEVNLFTILNDVRSLFYIILKHLNYFVRECHFSLNNFLFLS